MIMYVVTIKQDGEVLNKFFYADEDKANKTIADNKFTDYEVIKEIIQFNKD